MNADQAHSLENFARALAKLEKFLSTPIVDERDKAGIIQAFEYTFELGWKSVQKLAREHSKTIGSPKQAFQAAFELGWIAEDSHSKWIKMVDDRNLTTHTYRETLADEILARIAASHLAELKGLLQALRAEA
jgi:nucleotidyltransferase substrate binding protein (TIGR01987 family)